MPPTFQFSTNPGFVDRTRNRPASALQQIEPFQSCGGVQSDGITTKNGIVNRNQRSLGFGSAEAGKNEANEKKERTITHGNSQLGEAIGGLNEKVVPHPERIRSARSWN